MKRWLRNLLIGAPIAAVIGFGAYFGFLWWIGIYASDPVWSTRRGAIDGYDPVAYFRQNRPVQGQEAIAYEWNGATWHFASADNLEAFRAAPERYAPQFGGYCAFAVAHGYTAKVSPEAWHVADGKLYLNYDLGIREKWLERKPEFIAEAAANWPRVIED